MIVKSIPMPGICGEAAAPACEVPCHHHDSLYYRKTEFTEFYLEQPIEHEPGYECVVPSDEILAHLRKPNRYNVIMDYPSKIIEAGQDPDEVFQAACYFLDHGLAAFNVGPDGYGYWANGNIHCQAGEYTLKNQVDVPGRVGVHGSLENVRHGGTRFGYGAGGTLETEGKDANLVKSWPTETNNHDSSFFCHFTNLAFDCRDVTSGLWWGGAQCSSVRRVQVTNVATDGVGFTLGRGSNGCILENVWVDGGGNSGTIAFNIESYTTGITIIGCKGENAGTSIYFTGATQCTLLGYYNETCGLPMDIYGGGSTTIIDAIGFCSKAFSHREGGKAIVVRSTQDGIHLNMTGQVRDVDDDGADVDCGVITPSGFIKVADGISETGELSSFDLNLYDFINQRPRELSEGTVLTWGRRYHESFTGGDDRTYSFLSRYEETDQKDITLWVTTSGTCTVGFPASYVAGTVGTSTSVSLVAGNHELRFTEVEGAYRLTVN